jgi:hypothetical protein
MRTELSPIQQQQIKDKLDCAARESDLRLSGISIRTEQSFSGLPHACAWSKSALAHLMRNDKNAVLCFWTAISAIEGAITSVRQSDCPAYEVASYVAAKFFFTLVRNVALVNGDLLSSYQDICMWVNKRKNDIPTTELYGAKTGKLASLSAFSIEASLGEKSLSALLGSNETAVAIAREVREYSEGRAPLKPSKYTAIATDLAPDDAARRVACWETTKFNKSLCRNEHSNEK